MEVAFDETDTLSRVLFFKLSNATINKTIRHGPKGYRAFRFIGSAQIIDLEGDVIDLRAIAEVKPIMLKQGGRIQGFHTNQPAGEFYDWGFTKRKGAASIWIDVEVYDDYPTQKENLRRILLPVGDSDRINGVSLGGFKLAKQKECDQFRCWTHITKIEGWEYSLVDRMANPLAENIEDEIENMEFDVLNKQTRDEQGRFGSNAEVPISSIETTTVTKYDNNYTTSTDDCKCGKHGATIVTTDIATKGDYKEEPKDKKKENGEPEEKMEEKPSEEGEPPVEGEEEIEADGEQGTEEVAPIQEDPSDPVPDERQVLVEMANDMKTLMAALNINKEEEEMESPTIVEIEGQKYIKKDDGFVPYVEEAKPEETPETAEKTELTPENMMEALTKHIDDSMKVISDKFMEVNKEKPTGTDPEPIPPLIEDDKIEKIDAGAFYIPDSNTESRLNQIGNATRYN